MEDLKKRLRGGELVPPKLAMDPEEADEILNAIRDIRLAKLSRRKGPNKGAALIKKYTGTAFEGLVKAAVGLARGIVGVAGAVAGGVLRMVGKLATIALTQLIGIVILVGALAALLWRECGAVGMTKEEATGAVLGDYFDVSPQGAVRKAVLQEGVERLVSEDPATVQRTMEFWEKGAAPLPSIFKEGEKESLKNIELREVKLSATEEDARGYDQRYQLTMELIQEFTGYDAAAVEKWTRGVEKRRMEREGYIALRKKDPEGRTRWALAEKTPPDCAQRSSEAKGRPIGMSGRACPEGILSSEIDARPEFTGKASALTKTGLGTGKPGDPVFRDWDLPGALKENKVSKKSKIKIIIR